MLQFAWSKKSCHLLLMTSSAGTHYHTMASSIVSALLLCPSSGMWEVVIALSYTILHYLPVAIERQLIGSHLKIYQKKWIK
jgi:hypothetical protein